MISKGRLSPLLDLKEVKKQCSDHQILGLTKGMVTDGPNVLTSTKFIIVILTLCEK
jgi:hypothetical protein